MKRWNQEFTCKQVAWNLTRVLLHKMKLVSWLFLRKDAHYSKWYWNKHHKQHWPSLIVLIFGCVISPRTILLSKHSFMVNPYTFTTCSECIFSNPCLIVLTWRVSINQASWVGYDLLHTCKLNFFFQSGCLNKINCLSLLKDQASTSATKVLIGNSQGNKFWK